MARAGNPDRPVQQAVDLTTTERQPDPQDDRSRARLTIVLLRIVGIELEGHNISPPVIAAALGFALAAVFVEVAVVGAAMVPGIALAVAVSGAVLAAMTIIATTLIVVVIVRAEHVATRDRERPDSE